LSARTVQIIWPILVMIFGLTVMCPKCKCCKDEACETK
jgi:hypothetical protein